MKLRVLVLALMAALGAGCATTEKTHQAMDIEPMAFVQHGGVSAASYYHLGRYYHGQRLFVKAEEAYQKSLKLDAKNIEVMNALAALYAEQGQLARATTLFEQTVQFAPASAHSHNNLGFAYLLAGRHQDAYQAIRYSLLLDPASQRAWANLGQLAKVTADARLVAASKSLQTRDLPEQLAASKTDNVHSWPATSVAQPALEPKPENNMVASVAAPPDASPVASDESAVLKADAIEPQPANALTNAHETQQLSTPSSAPVALDAPKAQEAFAFVSIEQEKPTEPREADARTSPQNAPAIPSLAENSQLQDYSKIRVEVSNANGVSGFAKDYTRLLVGQHVVVKRITNYDSYTLSATVVEYQPGFALQAQALVQKMQLPAEIRPAKTERFNSDIRLILGRDIVQAVRSVLAGKKSS